MLPESSQGPRTRFRSAPAIFPTTLPLVSSCGRCSAAHGTVGIRCFAPLRAGAGPGVRRNDDGGERRGIFSYV
ncbi:hypothetical protein BDN70DRAFT_883443 [Pholiota conissans]|uniref:Uncharacterized protein n=1 Tax=Pholiota conissans TaxID=109636 RepID=A0A9P6CWX7_9AGAR|nr:hypothetical protein BDN70DRAFT_883443 [Pholiota conissans]